MQKHCIQSTAYTHYTLRTVPPTPPLTILLMNVQAGTNTLISTHSHKTHDQNCAADDAADEFADEVRMWVYEEDCEVRSTVFKILNKF